MRHPHLAVPQQKTTAANDSDDPTAATDPDDPTAATDSDDPTAATDSDDPTAATDSDDPTAATDSDDPTAARVSLPIRDHVACLVPWLALLVAYRAAASFLTGRCLIFLIKANCMF